MQTIARKDGVYGVFTGLEGFFEYLVDLLHSLVHAFCLLWGGFVGSGGLYALGAVLCPVVVPDLFPAVGTLH